MQLRQWDSAIATNHGVIVEATVRSRDAGVAAGIFQDVIAQRRSGQRYRLASKHTQAQSLFALVLFARQDIHPAPLCPQRNLPIALRREPS